jgi:glycosyltransferase involved in cell wall biosynthesis
MKNDPRFRLITSEWPGNVARARNLALDEAKGEYILFADADDLVCPQYARRLYEVLEEGRKTDPGIGIATCTASDVIECGQENYICDDRAEPVIMNIEDYSFHRWESHRVVWGAIYAREAIGSLRFDESFRCSTDTLFFAELLKIHRRYIHVSERLYCYICQDTSVSRGQYDLRRFDDILVWQKIAELYRKEPHTVRYSAASKPVLSAVDAEERLIREGTRDRLLQQKLAAVYRFHFAGIFHSPCRYSVKYWLAAVSPELFRKAVRRRVRIDNKAGSGRLHRS